MARFLGLFALLAVVLYGIWPYYSILRIDRALEDADAQTLAPLVDLAAIRSHYKARIGSSLDGFLPDAQQGRQRQADGSQSGAPSGRQRGDPSALQIDADKVLDWLSANVKQLGDAALDEAITLDWVHRRLLAATERANGPTGTSFIQAVDFAFFESWNRFVIRLGKLGRAPTFVTLTFEGGEWRITDITD